MVAGYVKDLYWMLEDFLLDSSWVFIAALLLIPSLAFGGIKLGFLVLFAPCIGEWLALGFCYGNLALMGLSVFLSVAVGVILVFSVH